MSEQSKLYKINTNDNNKTCPQCGYKLTEQSNQPGIRVKAEEVLAFLNLKRGSKRGYRPVDVNIELIIQRLKSGATIEDCKAVIAKKARDWLGTDMEVYLRPATLFNRTKFEQYLGELEEIK